MGPPLSGSERVLVRLPGWVGDFVASEPLVRALHEVVERTRTGELTLVGRAAHLELLDGRFPRARRLPLEQASGARAWRGHDVALLAVGSLRSAWQAFRARIPRRVGFARDGRGFLLTDALDPAAERGRTPLGLGRPGRAPRHLPRPLTRSLSELAGLLGVPVRSTAPRIDASEAALAAARARRAALGLDHGAPFFLASVGARADSSKGVPAELWSAALRELCASASSTPVVLCGGPGEEARVEAVLAGLAGVRAFALTDPPAGLVELRAHLADATLFLGGDTGPRHLARAAGKRAVVVSGPTDPRHCGVDVRERLVRVTVPCGPCHRERCPLTGAANLRCMHELAPKDVVQAARDLLAPERQHGP